MASGQDVERAAGEPAGYGQRAAPSRGVGKSLCSLSHVAVSPRALPAGLSNTVAAEAPASGWRAPLAWWGWQSVHAYSYLMMAVLAVSDLVRVWSLHVVTIPLRSLVVLAALWVTFAVPATLAGRYLGGQARPLSALVDSRLVYLLGVLAFVLAWFIHVWRPHGLDGLRWVRRRELNPRGPTWYACLRYPRRRSATSLRRCRP